MAVLKPVPREIGTEMSRKPSCFEVAGVVERADIDRAQFLVGDHGGEGRLGVLVGAGAQHVQRLAVDLSVDQRGSQRAVERLMTLASGCAAAAKVAAGYGDQLAGRQCRRRTRLRYDRCSPATGAD
jgi:hypothetical protein